MVTSSAVVGSSAISSLRSAGQRHGDERALPHPAGELVRVLLESPGRIRDADLVEQVGSFDHGLRSLHAAMPFQHLGHLDADGHHRVQARQRVLEDHCEVATPPVAHPVDRQREQVGALEIDDAGDGVAAFRQQPHDRQRGHRLAAAGLTDQAYGLARPHVETHPVDRLERFNPAAVELHPQVADGKQCLGHLRSPPILRVEGFPERLTEQGEAEGDHDDAAGRPEGQAGVGIECGPAPRRASDPIPVGRCPGSRGRERTALPHR